MCIIGNLYWRPRQVFPSVGQWATTSGRSTALKPLPPDLLDDGRVIDRWHLAELSDGKVIGDARLVATAENDVPGQLQILHGETNPEEHWALRQKRFRWPRRL